MAMVTNKGTSQIQTTSGS